jgi:hypothetical protein
MTLCKSFLIKASGLVSVLFLLCLSLTGGGCRSLLSYPGEGMPPTETDIAELSPASLKAPVVDFKWNYPSGDSHVRVTGTLVNITGGPLHGARVKGILYDQTGESIASGDSFVNPSYLANGSKGTFEFVAMVKKKQAEVTHTRLVSTVWVPSY